MPYEATHKVGLSVSAAKPSPIVSHQTFGRSLLGDGFCFSRRFYDRDSLSCLCHYPDVVHYVVLVIDIGKVGVNQGWRELSGLLNVGF